MLFINLFTLNLTYNISWWKDANKDRTYLINKVNYQNIPLSYINNFQIFFEEMGVNPNSYVISDDIKNG